MNHNDSCSDPATDLLFFFLPEIFKILDHKPKGNIYSDDQSNLHLDIIYHYHLSHRTVLRSHNSSLLISDMKEKKNLKVI